MEKLILHTGRLLIRNLNLSDLSNFHAYRSNPEVTKYQGFDVFTMEQAESFIISQKIKLLEMLANGCSMALKTKQPVNLLAIVQ